MKKVYLVVLSVFILLILGACDSITSSGTDKIIFGTGTFEEGITNEKSTFSQDEDILLETYLDEPFGVRNIQYTLLQEDGNGGEVLYDDWEDSVDPTWDSLVSEFHLIEYDGTFEPGNYILRMYKNDSELISEGTFSIE